MADLGERSSWIYHVAFEQDWNEAQNAGEYRLSTRGATLDEVGFIHASFVDQVSRVGGLVFATATDPVVVLVIDTSRLGSPVVVENLEGGSELFPHIYGPVPVDAVVEVLPARVGESELMVERLPPPTDP